MKTRIKIFFLYILLFLAFFLLAYSAKAQQPRPYVPCNETRDDEFHPLRPYQASPCNEPPNSSPISELAKFCGNQLTLQDNISSNDPDARCTIFAGRIECFISRSKRISIDLSEAELPILGNTEITKNFSGGEEMVEESTLMNEYVSWYLNGTAFRTEVTSQPFLKELADDIIPEPLEKLFGLDFAKERKSKLVNYSGPIRKLLPLSIRQGVQISTIEKAKNQDVNGDGNKPPIVERHNQFVLCSLLGRQIGCGDITTIPLIGGFLQDVTKKRLDFWNSERPAAKIRDIIFDFFGKTFPFVGPFLEEALGNVWIKNVPPLPWQEEFKGDFQKYLKAYYEWSGKSCIIIRIPLFGVDSLFCTNLPIISPPDRFAKLFPFVPLSSTEDRKGLVEIEEPVLEKNENSEVQILDISFSNQEPAELFFPHVKEVSELSSLLQKTYVAKGQMEINPNYKSIPPSGSCDLVSVRSNPGDKLFGKQIEGNLSYSVKFSCEIQQGSSPSACVKTVDIPLFVNTESPLLDEIWQRTVDGPTSVFKRFFPKIDESAPIKTIVDMPASSRVVYSGEGNILAGNPSSGKSGSSAEIYFPHLGGIKEYFLDGIQTLLRPYGFGNTGYYFSGARTTACRSLPPLPEEQQHPGGNCQPASSGWCSPETLVRYGWPEDVADKASMICLWESGGDPTVLNDGCLCQRTLDYSIGLFQINLLAHCASDGFTYTKGPPPSCSILNQSLISSCLQKYMDPEENIRFALELYKQKGWAPWAASARRCGIIP